MNVNCLEIKSVDRLARDSKVAASRLTLRFVGFVALVFVMVVVAALCSIQTTTTTTTTTPNVPKHSIQSKTLDNDDAPSLPTFQCKASRQKIPNAHVNDDYCDCSDGSDEPLNAACSNLFPSRATFACTRGNAEIYASRVGDGRCDCCDGEDEPEVMCANKCPSLRRKSKDPL